MAGWKNRKRTWSTRALPPSQVLLVFQAPASTRRLLSPGILTFPALPPPAQYPPAQNSLVAQMVKNILSLSMGFSRQEYWSGLPFPPPGDLPDAGIKPESLPRVL